MYQDLIWNLVHQGGEEFQPDKYLTDRIKSISKSFIFIDISAGLIYI